MKAAVPGQRHRTRRDPPARHRVTQLGRGGGDALAAAAELVVGPAAERFLVRTGVKRKKKKNKKGKKTQKID